MAPGWEVLSARSAFDAPVTDPRAQSLADDAANYRAADPGRAFKEPYVIPERHIERLEAAGRRRAARSSRDRFPAERSAGHDHSSPAIPQGPAHPARAGPGP